MLKMQSSLKVLAIVIVSMFVTACSTDNPLMSSIQSAVKKRYGSVDDLAIKKSGLTGIFNNHADSDFPRVALTIHSLSPNSFTRPKEKNDATGGILPPTSELADSCIEFSAVVWDSPKVSRNVDKLSFCTSDARRMSEIKMRDFNMNNTFISWAKGENRCVVAFDSKACTTGTARTNGPNPPDSRIPPGDYTYKKFSAQTTYFVITFDSLLQAMGLDIQSYDSAADKRVWITKMPS